MGLLMLGLSHKSASVELREALAFEQNGRLQQAYAQLKGEAGMDELVLLSTCNRVEAYAVAADPAAAEQRLRAFFEAEAGARAPQARKALQSLHGEPMLEHLLHVAASLDSMVLGEAQILGQVKEAYDHAVQAKSVGPLFHGLFQRVFAAAKEVRTRTEIGQHAASVPSIAVQLAERLFGDLTGKCALILGAGEMAELTAEYLQSAGCSPLLFANRSLPKAKALAQRFGGQAHGLDELEAILPQADVLLCSTGASSHVLGQAPVAKALHARGNRPQLYIDIAVPRNLDPAIGDLENAYRYDLDSLSALAEEHREKRLEASHQAEVILKHRLRDLKEWLAAAKVVPTVSRLSAHFEAVRAAELEKQASKLAHLDPKDRERVEALSRAIIQKLLHSPVSRLKQHAAKGGRSAELVSSVEELFGLSPEEEA
jgi:glutamyl-tRNA reductase